MNAGSRTYSIRELENFCGIKAHTIRMWEKRYGILTPGRSNSNIRHYTEEELKKLLAISILNRHGLKISKIARLNDNEILREVLNYGSAEEKYDSSFNPGELIMSALRFSEDEFREKLSLFINEKGLEEAYIKVFHPLMQKAKALWLTDTITKAQEHFIRHIVRTLLISEELASSTPLRGDSAAIINLSGSEWENDLLFLKYLLRSRGIDTLYSEGNLSVEDIRGIHTIKPFTILALNIPASEPDDEVKKFSKGIANELKLKKVLVTGRYDSSVSWNIGKTEAVCSPAGLAKWADRLRKS
jgi:DNA-binding transcriptional MerR regulator